MIIYVDGSARPNPGPGGFGVVIVEDDNDTLIETYGKQCKKTTNNAEELKAILYTLVYYGKYEPIVYSDSAYAINSLITWRDGWKRNGWLKSDNKTPENIELIKAFDELWNKGYRIDLRKIKGHSNHKWNDLADSIAAGETKI